MQFIEGDDLRKLIERQRGRFPPGEVVARARTVLEALCYLHSHVPPIVHRDIKPANLKRTPRGEIVLLDFGLAKGRPGDRAVPPADRSVFGYTLSYSPLEQILGRRTDPPSDVYSIGATLYHLLTGVPPVNALDRQQAVASGKADPLQVAHLIETGITENLGRVIAQAMALDRADRYASAIEMLAALNACGVDETTQITLPDHRPESRRIDAAAPSRAQVGRRIDLLVQVRFGGSPRLGVEDWPSRQRPTEIEQGSEALQLAYPTDPQSGRFLPARLRISVVAPDFKVENQAERLIEVPPDEYSKRLAFLLTPLRTGWCRINVEVYGLDDLFLGAVPVEVEAVAATVPAEEIRVGNLALEVVARQVAALLLGAGVAAASSPASLAAGEAGSAAMTRFSPQAPEVARSAEQPTVASESSATRSAREREAMELMARATAAAQSSELDGDLSSAEAASRASSPLVGRATIPAPAAAAKWSPQNRLLRAAMLTAPLAVVVFVAATLLNTRRDAPPASTVIAPASPSTGTEPASPPAATAPGSTARRHEPAPAPAATEPKTGPTPPPVTAVAPLSPLTSAPAPAQSPVSVPEPAGSAVRPMPTPGGASPPVNASPENLQRANAQRMVEQSRTLARSDVVSAVKRLREALALDPKAAGGTELMSALETQLVVDGEAALTSARNFDRYKRSAEAIREFDRAIQLLELVPGGHKDLALARQRSAQLKAPR
jgi:Protein kinase domain